MTQKTRRLLLILHIFSVCFVVFLIGCASNPQGITENCFLLDTVVSVTFYSKKDHGAVSDAMELCREYETVFSRTDPKSELYKLNEARSADISDTLLTVLETGLRYCEMSGGKFDITMGGVSSLYDFSETAPHRPDKEALEKAVSAVGYGNVHIDGNHVSINGDAVIDLGAIAKGYIADAMKKLLIESGVEHAIISLGGNIQVIGTKPDGNPYAIGVQYPEKASQKLAATVGAQDISIVTSGSYERFFVENGITYHHILDPEIGEPVRNGLVSVSVIGPDSMDCDALSTVCFVMGLDGGTELINSIDGYEAMFISEDGERSYSDNFEKFLK